MREAVWLRARHAKWNDPGAGSAKAWGKIGEEINMNQQAQEQQHKETK